MDTNDDRWTDRWTDKVITIGPPLTLSGGALNNCSFGRTNFSSQFERALSSSVTNRKSQKLFLFERHKKHDIVPIEGYHIQVDVMSCSNNVISVLSAH